MNEADKILARVAGLEMMVRALFIRDLGQSADPLGALEELQAQLSALEERTLLDPFDRPDQTQEERDLMEGTFQAVTPHLKVIEERLRSSIELPAGA